MTSPEACDRVRVTVTVRLPVERAFALFTAEIDRWWRKGRRYRVFAGGAPSVVHLEPFPGGRLFEEIGDPPRLAETGRVVVWEPPTRLVLAWRSVAFAPEERTQVEVVFTESGSTTRVTVTHSGWASIRPDHPVRHGDTDAAFNLRMARWWGDLLSSLRDASS